jgi:hypothetical protein
LKEAVLFFALAHVVVVVIARIVFVKSTRNTQQQQQQQQLFVVKLCKYEKLLKKAATCLKSKFDSKKKRGQKTQTKPFLSLIARTIQHK